MHVNDNGGAVEARAGVVVDVTAIPAADWLIILDRVLTLRNGCYALLRLTSSEK
jgi:hypothetical protein